MEPIINSWLMWFVGFLNALRTISVTFLVIGTIFLGIITVSILMFREDLETTTIKLFNKVIRALIITTSICMLLALFVPDKDTAEKLIINSYITEDNINTVENDQTS